MQKKYDIPVFNERSNRVTSTQFSEVVSIFVLWYFHFYYVQLTLFFQ